MANELKVDRLNHCGELVTRIMSAEGLIVAEFSGEFGQNVYIQAIRLDEPQLSPFLRGVCVGTMGVLQGHVNMVRDPDERHSEGLS